MHTDSAPDIAAALVYVHDQMPGWHRVRRGRGFSYHDSTGQHIQDPAQIRRIQALAIPPAYTAVWICPNPAGHLQATGRDARGRKQYRYHPAWQARRAQRKFERMQAFAHHLPAIRRAVARDLRTSHPDLQTVAAAVVRLLDSTALRIGNDSYATHNGSFGLTTLRNRHVQSDAHTLRLRFKGKSGVEQQARVVDARLVRIVRRCQELPGQRLFQFVDAQDEVHHVRSEHINAYLRTISGEDFTAKDFRTWHASVLALAWALDMQIPNEASSTAAALSANAIVQRVAQHLGNTCAVCRKFYIHPDVLAFCALPPPRPRAAAARARKGLHAAECMLQAFLQNPVRLAAASPRPPKGMPSWRLG